LGAMQVARKIPFDDPVVLNCVRAGYIITQITCIAVYLYIAAKVKRKNDRTLLKYVEPKTFTNPEGGNLVTTTYRDYDLLETSKPLRAVFMGVMMMGFLHIYMKFTQPLFIQALMGIKSLVESKPFQLYILNKPADGDLKRPFKAPPGLFGAGGPATDKASIQEAEGKAAKKEE